MEVKLFWDDPELCDTFEEYCLTETMAGADGWFLTDFVIPGQLQEGKSHGVVATNGSAGQSAVGEYRATKAQDPPANDTLAPTIFLSHEIGVSSPLGLFPQVTFKARAFIR